MASLLNSSKVVVLFDEEELSAFRALLYGLAYDEESIDLLRERLAPLNIGFGKGQLEMLAKMNESLSWNRVG